MCANIDFIKNLRTASNHHCQRYFKRKKKSNGKQSKRKRFYAKKSF